MSVAVHSTSPRRLGRLAGAALAVAVAGSIPLLAAGSAYAGPDSSAQVTFRGGGLLGLGLLVCTSQPDESTLTVPAESTVTFVNHTGQRAVLRVDGQDAGGVGANQAVPVMFHRGPVSVSMVPECGLNLNQKFGSPRCR